MATIERHINPRIADRRLFLIAAIGFPLLVLIGYFKTYYFSAFFDVKPLATSLVHVHAFVMSLWVVFFTVQSLLIRTKNVKVHMTMGMAGVALAAVLVLVAALTAYDAHIVRYTGPPGIDPHRFFAIPMVGLVVFIILFSGAIYYRKKPAEHKGLMLLTAFVFLPAAFARMPVMPERFGLLWTDGVPILLAIACLIWHSVKHRKVNKVFALGTLLAALTPPLSIAISSTDAWMRFTGWLAG